MNNEEAARRLIETARTEALYLRERDYQGTADLLNNLAAALEARIRTPPATGAAAMREAAANYALDRARDHYDAGRVFVARNVKQLSEEIRALPAPEVPEAVKKWIDMARAEMEDGGIEYGDTAFALFNHLCAEYGL